MIHERTSVPPVLRGQTLNGFVLSSLGALVVVGLCLAAKLALQTGLSWRCPVMALFHFPCPSCGGTRAFAALSEMRFSDALRFNPLLVSAIPFTLVGFLFRGSLLRYARFGWPLFVAAVAMNWVYLFLFLPR